ncbi:PREDICTED: S-(+)-linalool synthase, chloroplastic-like [Tarenaya hassleriana]|uniref:S-(+)-linalool synthase, chloroplastic-like n=1 Tax=Tarenaya hassleriana TaxID=28532 RepID=UPI00053C5018|nr:PREDICTED: S-(+)-linalool synthase, chloroplastic-like [Tarenaya hassleriana]
MAPSVVAHVISASCFAFSLEPNKFLMFPISNFRKSSWPRNDDSKRLRANYVSASFSSSLKTYDKPNSVSHEFTIKKLRNILVSKNGENRFESLEMIDAIQRLGIDHHFRCEIEEILGTLYKQGGRYGCYGHHDLREVALCFRLLRQGAHHVPQSTFDVIRDKDGGFKDELQNDIKGLLELFEASQLSIEGEEMLDNAREFAVNRLKELCLTTETGQRQVILDILDRPLHKTLSRLTNKRFISMSNIGGEKEWWQSLQSVAEIDFKTLKSLHQEEISQTFKWWRDLGLAKKLRKARDQPLKWCTWSMAILQDRGLSDQRLDLTKPISLIYVIDDIFDVYGGLEELTSFTHVVERWDYEELENLLSHMRVCFEALDMVTVEISLKVYQKYGWNPMDSLRKSWGRLCKAFLVEAKWFERGYLPSTEEYLENGMESSGVHLVMLHVFFLLGEEITKEKVELIESNPKIVSSTATILRLWDDLGTAKDENQDGFDGSYIECYMNQNKGSTTGEARTHVFQMISKAWKCLNEECLNPKPFSRSSFAKACLNLARTVPMMYSYDDHHRLPHLDEYLK